MNLCPCKRCRPPGQSLKQAMKLCHDAAMIARLGVEGCERYKAAEKLRLAKLHEEKKRNEYVD